MIEKKDHFRRSVRIVDPNAYKNVFQNPKHKIRRDAFLLLAAPNQQNVPRLGYAVAKKYLKHATKRNRVKRCIRESFRTQKQRLAGLDIVIVLIRPPNQEEWTILNPQFQVLFEKLAKFHQSAA